MAADAAGRSNNRQAQRRAAVRLLNELATEVGVPKVSVKAGSENVLTMVRALDRRCSDSDRSERLRAVLESYVQNGGQLPVKLRPQPEAGDNAQPAPVLLQRHRVLDEGFRLQSKAFMLTFNSKEFTAGTWQPFRTWVKAKARKLHARHWAACLES